MNSIYISCFLSDLVLEKEAWSELGNLFSRYFDGLSRSRISTIALSTKKDSESSEARKSNLFAVFESVGDALHHSVKGLSRFISGKAREFRDQDNEGLFVRRFRRR